MAMRGLNADFLDEERLRGLGFASLGENVLIHPSVVLVNCGAMAIGSNVRIDAFTLLSAGKSITLGSNVHIASHCSLMGSEAIDIGDFCNVSHGSRIFSASDDFSGASLVGSMVPGEMRAVTAAPVRIGRHGGVGAGCIVLQGVDIGEGTVVAAMSLVRRSLPEWGIYGGRPLRRIGSRSKAVLALEASYRAT